MGKDFTPLQNYVLLEAITADKKTLGGIIITGSKEDKQQVDVFVVEMGPEAKGNFKIGDCVVFNEYDAKWLGRNNNRKYVLVKDVSVMAVIPDPNRVEDLSVLSN